MHRTLTALLLAASLAPSARADKFWFLPAVETHPAVEGALSDWVEGVLLSEADGLYVIRVEGGEITVPKAMVLRVEQDDLTVAELERREADAQAALAVANERRWALLDSIADARQESLRVVQAAEATASRSEAVAEAAVLPDLAPEIFPRYDPILDVVVFDIIANEAR